MIRAKRVGATAAAAILLFCSLPVSAQTALEDSIANRTGPHTKPIGMVVGPFGSFLLFPKVTLENQYTDNLFSEEADKNADIAFVLKPSFTISSDWDNHAVNFSATAAQARYIDNVDENSLDYGFDLNGRLDALTKSTLTAALVFDKKHQDRGDPDDDVGGVHRHLRLLLYLLPDAPFRVGLQTTGVYQDEIVVVPTGVSNQPVSGGPSHVGDDGVAASQDPVEKGGLAYVRPPHDCDNGLGQNYSPGRNL